MVLGVIFEALGFILVAFWRDLGSLLLILMVLAGSWMAGWMLAGPVVGQRDPRIQSPSPVVVKRSFPGPYASLRIQSPSPVVVKRPFPEHYRLAHWRLKAQGYKTRDYRIQDARPRQSCRLQGSRTVKTED